MPRNFVSLTTVMLALLASASCAAPGSADKPGIEGRVQLSPGCPGPQRIDQPACVSAMPDAVVVLQTPHGKIVHKSATDSDGFFSVLGKPETEDYLKEVSENTKVERKSLIY